MRYTVFALLMACLLVCSTGVKADELYEQEFFHQLKAGEPSQSWEHRIDLTDAMMQNGKAFVAREIDLREGKLVVEAEELTQLYYYVKVRLAKPHPSVPMAGKIKIQLTVADHGSCPFPPDPPANLALSPVGAALKPVFTWKTDAKYAKITLYDMTTQETVWERISTTKGYKAFDEGFLTKGHHYKWAVRVSYKQADYSNETVAAFRIDEVGGVVVAIPE
ncbi:MAG: hypothetical protein Kow0029_26760 [Candidatus Rifleibacteriota bacterium]